MKKFSIQDENANVVAGMSDLSEDNVYVSTYGSLLPGHKKPSELEVGELCKKKYSLSGQKGKVYVIVRTE